MLFLGQLEPMRTAFDAPCSVSMYAVFSVDSDSSAFCRLPLSVYCRVDKQVGEERGGNEEPGPTKKGHITAFQVCGRWSEPTNLCVFILCWF